MEKEKIKLSFSDMSSKPGKNIEREKLINAAQKLREFDKRNNLPEPVEKEKVVPENYLRKNRKLNHSFSGEKILKQIYF